MMNPDENTNKTTPRMPVLFIGHGSPLNAITDNRWSRGFAELSSLVPQPKAILAISAHWFVSGTYLTGQAKPKTIHDFSGFPRELHEVNYPAPGNVDLARRVRSLLGEERASLDEKWGFDHGTWSVLKWMFPRADVPLIQLSIDRRLEPKQHVELARSLAALREEGVLVVGSGNIVHNLSDAFSRLHSGAAQTPPWALNFDRDVAAALTQRDEQALVRMWPHSEHAHLAHPSPDHWLPLLYTFAATDANDEVRFPDPGFDLGSISMRNVVFG
ncbi:MAG: hypothetical protein RJA70_1119 [Pseudomonadota bacterium]|jgi:4,5-DOPA dioxygenase extradiol